MAKDNKILIIIGIVVLLVLFSGKIDLQSLGLQTVFPGKTQINIWELNIKDQMGTNVYNEGDTLQINVALTSERVADLNVLAETQSIIFDKIIQGNGLLWYRTYPNYRCNTPDIVYNNPNYVAKAGSVQWTWIPGKYPPDPWINPGDCSYSECPAYYYDANYKTGKYDCGPFIFIGNKLAGYDLDERGNVVGTSLTPGFKEIEYLGWYTPAYGSEAKTAYLDSLEMYLRTEIYVIPDPCDLSVDQALVLEGPFVDSFSKEDLAHSQDKFCSRFAPIILNTKMGWSYDDIALEYYDKLISGQTITPESYEEIYAYYVTSDFGVLCETDEAYYNGECVRPSQLLNVQRCEDGTLEVQEDGTVICLREGQIFIKCEPGATFDQELQQCIIIGKTELNCIEGIWDETSQSCIVEKTDVTYSCDSGFRYDYNLDKCISTSTESTDGVSPIGILGVVLVAALVLFLVFRKKQ